MPTILLPRPAPLLPRAVAALVQAGIPESSLIPLALTTPTPVPFTLPPNAQALWFTSQLAIATLIQSDVTNHLPHSLKSLPAHCVGPATAAAAQAAGFTVALTGPGNAAQLTAQVLARKLPPTHFFHPHGPHPTPAIWQALTAGGHTVTPGQTYALTPLTTLPPATVAQLQATPPTLTLLWSPASASALAKLLKAHQLPPSPHALCLSPAVAKAAQNFWPNCHTSLHPTAIFMQKKLASLLPQV
jgi:uroporphyrinogen-III synthase